MRKGVFLFSLFIIFSTPVMAANYVPKQFANTNTGEGLYPYSLNNRRQQPKAKNYASPIGGGAAPMQQTGKRGVVKRPVRARAASAQTSATQKRVVQRNNIARSATNSTAFPRGTTGRTIDNRGVVARGTTLQSQTRSSNARRTITYTSSSTAVSSDKCFANYKECMEMYCKREETAYNRCFCSAKLAQIDSKYQNKIESLIQQIMDLKLKSQMSDDDEELSSAKEYWEETIGKYYTEDDNPWLNLNTSLDDVYKNLEWADTETRVRGQNAFNTGHQYCVNYLHSCAYMASNLRDAYKSEIARDCATYEDTLKKIKSAAESVIEHYSK